MQVRKTIRLIITFYKRFFLATSLITGCCLLLFYEYGLPIFAVLCWLKAITLGITFYFINSYKNKEYYYYLNAGISKALLWTTTLIFDFTLFIFLIMQLYKFK